MTNNNALYGFKGDFFEGIKILDFRYLYDHYYQEMIQPQKVDNYLILWFQRGKTTHWVDFESMNIDKENTLIFVKQNSLQRFHQQKNIKGKAILFSENFFCKTKNDTYYLKANSLFHNLKGISKLELEDSKYIFLQIFNQLELELSQTADNLKSDLLKNLLHNFLLQAERIQKSQNFVRVEKDQNYAYALEFQELLETHYITEKNVSFYYKKLGISAKKLNKATLKTFAKGPKSIIIDRIILEAKRKLVHTMGNTKEISNSLGFKEPTNFIKFFKKNLNITPLLFRENNK